MATFALYAHLKAKPGKAADVEAFLKSALPLAEKEPGTVTWYAFQESDNSYGIFDAFDTEEARQAHLDGPIAKALMAKASEAARRAAGDSQDPPTRGEAPAV